MFIVFGKKQIILAAAVLLLVAAIITAILLSPRAAAASYGDPPTVYLTFDDGPSANTEKVLDILAEEKIAATFFVVGHTSTYEKELYRRIAAEGHALGLHSYSHRAADIYGSLEAFIEDFERIEELIREVTGQSPKICRMPGGTNTKNCEKALRGEILDYFDSFGYACFDWDVDPLDSGSYTLSAEQLYASVIRQSKKLAGKDIVVLMHDDSLRTSLPDALPVIIGYFKDAGYNFDVLTGDLTIAARR